MGVSAAGHYCPIQFTSASEGTELVQRTRKRLSRLAIIANGAGATDTFLFCTLLLPPTFDGIDATTAILVNAALFAILLPTTFILGTRWGYQKSASLIDWVGQRDPTPAERDQALHIAQAHAVQAAWFWLAAAVMFGILSSS